MSGTVETKRPVAKKLKPAPPKKEEEMTRRERSQKELSANWDMVEDLGTILKEEQVRPPTFIDGSKSRSLNELAEVVKRKIETNFENKEKIMKARKQRRKGRPTTARNLPELQTIVEGGRRTRRRKSKRKKRKKKTKRKKRRRRKKRTRKR